MPGFKKHNWMNYGENGDVLEITIKDLTGRRLDFFRCNNNKDYKRVISIIRKYGFEVEENKNINKELIPNS